MPNIDNDDLDIVPSDDPDVVAVPEEELFQVGRLRTPGAQKAPDEEVLGPAESGAEPEETEAESEESEAQEAQAVDSHAEREPEELTPEDQALIDALETWMPKQARDWNIKERDLTTARMMALRIINRTNHERPREPIVYRFGGQLARVEPGEDGSMAIVILDRVRLRHLLSLLIDFFRLAKLDDGRIRQLPDMAPTWLCEDVMIAPNPALPVLEGVANAPVFTKGGKLVADRGYCPDSRLFYDPTEGLNIPDIPLMPTPEQIAWAKRMIVDELLGDFPFAGPAERATAAALFLLPFVRGLIDGPTPLHLIEKPSPGTGASLMVEAITLVAEGRPAAGMTAPTGDDEMDKRLLSQFKRGGRTILFDNLRRKLDSGSLAMALTGDGYEGRELGRSAILRFKVGCSWIATANNPRLSNEIARRTVRIRLDAHVDEPWRRAPETFRHPHLLDWVRQKRGSLICAALLLGRAWVSAGRPAAPGNPTLGMFESWAKTLGGVLHVAGIPGFLMNLDALYATTDDESVTLRAFITAWWHTHGPAAKRVSELFDLAVGIEPPLPLGDTGERGQRVRLGQLVSNQRDRQFNIVLGEVEAAQWRRERLDVRVTSAGTVQNAQVWKLEPVP